MAISITTKQIFQWLGGLATALLLGSIKYSVEVSSKHNEELKQKVDKIYDYATNHEVRMKIMETEIQEHSMKILDLQLAQERLGASNNDLQSLRKQNQTSVSAK